MQIQIPINRATIRLNPHQSGRLVMPGCVRRTVTWQHAATGASFTWQGGGSGPLRLIARSLGPSNQEIPIMQPCPGWTGTYTETQDQQELFDHPGPPFLFEYVWPLVLCRSCWQQSGFEAWITYDEECYGPLYACASCNSLLDDVEVVYEKLEVCELAELAAGNLSSRLQELQQQTEAELRRCRTHGATV